MTNFQILSGFTVTSVCCMQITYFSSRVAASLRLSSRRREDDVTHRRASSLLLLLSLHKNARSAKKSASSFMELAFFQKVINALLYRNMFSKIKSAVFVALAVSHVTTNFFVD